MSRFVKTRTVGIALAIAVGFSISRPASAQVPPNAEVHDSHFHLSNYIQKGLDIRDFVKMMGDKVGRAWHCSASPVQTDLVSSPTLGTWRPLLHRIRMLRSITTRLPMHKIAHAASLAARTAVQLTQQITRFNPADMYAVDHIARVLRTFPGVLTGVGEFTIHKELVSPKVAGPAARLTNPALDRILNFCTESGLLRADKFTNDTLTMPFSRPGVNEPVHIMAQHEEPC